MQFSGEAAFLLAQELKRLAGSAGVPRSKGHAGAKSFPEGVATFIFALCGHLYAQLPRSQQFSLAISRLEALLDKAL